jgi:hypothetical protein
MYLAVVPLVAHLTNSLLDGIESPLNRAINIRAIVGVNEYDPGTADLTRLVAAVTFDDVLD